MATRMLTLRRSDFLLKLSYRASLLLVTSSSFFSAYSFAAEFTIEPAITLDYYQVDASSFQSISGDSQSQDTEEYVIRYAPSLSLAYQSKKLSVSSFAEYIRTQHEEKVETDHEYLNYQLNTHLQLLPETLSWQTNISKSHRVADSRLGVFSDEIVGSENLTGISNIQSNLTYQIANRRQLNMMANAFYSQSKADDTVEADLTDSNFNPDRFNTNSKGASLLLGSGIVSQGFDWQINLSMSESDRSSQEDYSQARFLTDLDIPVTQTLGWVLNARIDKNKIDNDTALSDGLSYREYGTGLRWSFTRESYISLLAYRSKTGDREAQDYIGGEFSWIPSTRSSLFLKAGRNQFGENYTFSLEQNSRFVKTRAQFSQGVDINSRRQFTSSVVGSFVCPLDTLNFAECFQPTDPNYQPNTGEQVINVIGQDVELNDEVIKFSSGSLNIGYDNSRKLKVNLSYGYSKQEGLEGLSIGNNRESQSVNLSASYAMSPKSQLVLNLTTGERVFLNESNEASGERTDKNTSASLFLNAELSRRLSAQAGISKRKRDSNVAGLDIEDNRINLQVQYTY